MSIQYRYTHALTGNLWKTCLDDLTIFYLSKHTKRFLLALLLFSANERNNISFHLRPILKCLSCTGNCLIGCCNYFLWLKLFPRCKAWRITLDRTIWLYRNKSTCCSQTLLLIGNHIKMIGIDLRYNHRYVRCPAVRAVIGYYRSLCLCISLFNRFDFIFCHVHRTEYKINRFRYRFHFIDIMYNQILYTFRHRSRHLPTSANSFLICLSGRSWTCRNCHHFKPRMIL